MKKSVLIKLAGVLLVLVALISGRWLLQEKMPKKKNLYQKKMGAIRQNNIDGLEISQKEEKLILVKRNNTWQINEEKAKSEQVDDLLDKLFSIEGARLIAKTDRRHQELGVREEEALKIVFKQGDDNKLVLLIGSVGLEGGYIRFPDNSEVFLLSNLSQKPSLEKDSWLEPSPSPVSSPLQETPSAGGS